MAVLTHAVETAQGADGLSPELREEAFSLAHKLAGSLGMFGHSAATEHARRIEMELQPGGPADPARLRAELAAMRESLRSALGEETPAGPLAAE